MQETRQLDESGPPAVVGIAAIIGFGKAAFEGLFGIIALAAADSISDGFGLGATLFAIAYGLSAYFLWRGSSYADMTRVYWYRQEPSGSPRNAPSIDRIHASSSWSVNPSSSMPQREKRHP